VLLLLLVISESGLTQSRLINQNYSAAGLPELVVETQEAYEHVAVTLATDPPRLQALRRRLVETRETCPLFDTPRWVRNYEKGLRAVWRRYRELLGPADVVVVEEGEG
jgi:protein O-GlcNAc transferase